MCWSFDLNESDEVLAFQFGEHTISARHGNKPFEEGCILWDGSRHQSKCSRLKFIIFFLALLIFLKFLIIEFAL